MQLYPARRPNRTYGKGTKASRVHDLFEYRSNHHETSASASSTASPAPSPAAQPHLATHDPAKHLDSPLPEPSSEPSKPHVADKGKHKRPLQQDTALYDMLSSDDEDGNASDTSGSRTSKRRRLVGTRSDPPPSVQEGTQSTLKNVENSTKPLRKINKPRDNQRSAHSKDRSLQAPSVSQKPGQLASTKTAGSKMKSAELLSVQNPVAVRNPKSKDRPLVKSHRSEDAQLADRSGTDVSDCPSEHSNHSMSKSKITPRRKKVSPHGTDSDLSSPSNIGLTGLKLRTPGLSPAELSPDPSNGASTKHQRRRKRLIDRLDAPTNSAGATSDEQVSDVPARSIPTSTKKLTQTRSKLTRGGRKADQLQAANAHAGSSQDSQERTNWTTRPRTTYATQRSHLSDMVNDLDGLDEPSSQKSADDFLLKISASNAASQLELDDESDDSAGGGKLKSIHELRQAGVNNRFERELDALLEDIDAGKNASKALRIQALVKLVGKLQDPSFARHIATGGRIARLTSVSNQKTDLPTSILLVATYSALAESATISIGTLSQLFKAAITLAPFMLTEERSLTEIAKDRKQNLSKALIRDMLEFVETFAAREDSTDIASQFYSDWTVLHGLESILKRLVQLGDTSARLSTSVYATILRSLYSQVQHLEDHIDRSLQLSRLQTTLSLLELCSICVDDADLHIADIEYENLGNTLAEVIYQTANLSRSLEGSVLRVVVSLSNNRPRMCRLFGNTTISKATFSIIDENFLKLARQAEIEESLDQQKLDSVVLALGCLLNFAECDSALRTRLSHRKPDEEDYIAQLVTVFNSQVSKVDEALTTEQSQVSVAFGYLAMLLCTLSLHPSVKAQVTQLLHKKSFDELCGAAEKFFRHLRALEHISEDDAAMSTFTARFSAILETVRAL